MHSSEPRHYHWHDHFLSALQQGIFTLATHARKKNTATTAGRANPSHDLPPPVLTAVERTRSAGLMRVNHVGEICAQALYIGQSLTAKDTHIRATLQSAAQEEFDHLNWCAERISELNSHKSYLNPLWFTGSLCIGTCAGLLGDKWSLGFLAETEHQVFTHLSSHLEKLPASDTKSRAIVRQMQEEEAAHAHTAEKLGAKPLPWVVRCMMKGAAKVMTSVAYYV